MEKKRSVGVRVCGIAMSIYGIVLLFWGSNALLAIVGIIPPIDTLYKNSILEPIVIAPTLTLQTFQWLPFVAIIAGCIYLISSIGLIKFKKWAMTKIIYLSTLLLLFIPWITISLIIKGCKYRGFGEFLVPFIIISSLITNPFWPAIFFLIYFTRPKVKRAFTGATVGSTERSECTES